MSSPWIIWTVPRTGGTNLSAALKSLSERPAAEDEPFQFGDNPRQFSGVYERWRRRPSAIGELSSICEVGWCIKHIPESFDDAFNIALAQETERAGYRHIHLTRRDEFARLISRDVAEQLNAWEARDAFPLIHEILAGRHRLHPLDVPHLIVNKRLGEHRWRMIRPHLSNVVEITTEEIIIDPGFIIQRLALVLGLDCESAAKTLPAQGQDTKRIWHLIPNLDELRAALKAEDGA